jgi:hypothetical protein
LVSIFEGLLEGDEIYWFALIAELERKAINDLVCRNVERFRSKVQDADVGYIAWREQERTKDPFFTILAKWNGARSLARGEYVVRIL